MELFRGAEFSQFVDHGGYVTFHRERNSRLFFCRHFQGRFLTDDSACFRIVCYFAPQIIVFRAQNWESIRDRWPGPHTSINAPDSAHVASALTITPVALLTARSPNTTCVPCIKRCVLFSSLWSSCGGTYLLDCLIKASERCTWNRSVQMGRIRKIFVDMVQFVSVRNATHGNCVFQAICTLAGCRLICRPHFGCQL